MTRRSLCPRPLLLAALLAVAAPLALAPAAAFAQAAAKTAKPAAAGRTIEITGSDTMKFSVTTIQAKPGETLHIVLKAEGTMPKIAMSHNFVLLKAGADAAAFANAGGAARATNYVPPSLESQVIAKTALAGNGETVDVTFKAPTKPGSYTYLCTFPGHFASGMKGTLVVK